MIRKCRQKIHQTPVVAIDSLFIFVVYMNNFIVLEKQGPCPTHILVTCHGRFFYFDVIDKLGEPYTAPEIQQQLQRISDKCYSQQRGSGLGALTAADRTVWTKVNIL